MCIIILKPAGVNFPKDEYIENSWYRNNHGAGLAIRNHKEGKVLYWKGLMTFKNFQKVYEEIKKNPDSVKYDIALHFRIGTQGGNLEANTHPFLISSVNEDLKILQYYGEGSLLFHNGIINSMSDRNDTSLSDTMVFVKRFLSEKSFDYQRGVCQYAQDRDSSRFLLMHPTEGSWLFGEWEKEDGVYYSNKGYRWSSIKYDVEEISEKYYSYYYGKSSKTNKKKNEVYPQCDYCRKYFDRFDNLYKVQKKYNKYSPDAYLCKGCMKEWVKLSKWYTLGKPGMETCFYCSEEYNQEDLYKLNDKTVDDIFYVCDDCYNTLGKDMKKTVQEKNLNKEKKQKEQEECELPEEFTECFICQNKAKNVFYVEDEETEVSELIPLCSDCIKDLSLEKKICKTLTGRHKKKMLEMKEEYEEILYQEV